VENKLIHFIKVSMTVYIFYMFLYALWYYLHVMDFANLRIENEWIGSLMFLPHGARVLMICFFRYYSIPALYLAEITGPSLVNHDIYMVSYAYGYSFATLGCIFAVVAAVEIVKWSRATEGTFSLLKPISFKNYKFVILVIVISSLLSGIICNSIIAVLNNNMTIDVFVVLRFMVGDFLGSIVVLVAMWIIFSTLAETRLIISPND